MTHVMCAVLAIFYGEKLAASNILSFCTPADHCLICCASWLARVRIRFHLMHRVSTRTLAHPFTSQFSWYQHPFFSCSDFLSFQYSHPPSSLVALVAAAAIGTLCHRHPRVCCLFLLFYYLAILFLFLPIDSFQCSPATENGPLGHTSHIWGLDFGSVAALLLC